MNEVPAVPSKGHTTLILTGPYTGRTMVLQRLRFVEGVCRISKPPEALRGLIRQMGRYYQAYLEGSPELAAAEKVDGQLQDDVGAQQGEAASVSGQVRPERSGTGPRVEDERSGSDEDSEGPERVSAAGDVVRAGAAEEPQGSDPVGLSKESKSKIREALGLLDHFDDDHWTADDKPTVAVVSKFAGRNVTRAMIEAVAPEFERLGGAQEDHSETAEVSVQQP